MSTDPDVVIIDGLYAGLAAIVLKAESGVVEVQTADGIQTAHLSSSLAKFEGWDSSGRAIAGAAWEVP